MKAQATKVRFLIASHNQDSFDFATFRGAELMSVEIANKSELEAPQSHRMETQREQEFATRPQGLTNESRGNDNHEEWRAELGS